MRWLFALMVLAQAAVAVTPGERLADPALEARARAIDSELRCLVCQNQTIDQSDADLAHDLRLVVRQRLVAGDSNEQVKHYIVARYGEYVLLKPPFEPETWVLWLAPVLLLAGGAAVAVLYVRRQSREGEA